MNQQHVSSSQSFVSDVISFDIGGPCSDLFLLNALGEADSGPQQFGDPQEYVLSPRAASDEEEEEDLEDDEDEEDEEDDDDWEDDEDEEDFDEDEDEDDWEDDEDEDDFDDDEEEDDEDD